MISTQQLYADQSKLDMSPQISDKEVLPVIGVLHQGKLPTIIPPSRPVTSLGHQAKSFLRGAQIFSTMSNTFFREGLRPLVTVRPHSNYAACLMRYREHLSLVQLYEVKKNVAHFNKIKTKCFGVKINLSQSPFSWSNFLPTTSDQHTCDAFALLSKSVASWSSDKWQSSRKFFTWCKTWR